MTAKPEAKQIPAPIKDLLLKAGFSPVAGQSQLNPQDYPANAVYAEVPKTISADELLKVIDRYTSENSGAIVNQIHDQNHLIISTATIEEVRSNLADGRRQKFTNIER